jgi:hypothetical protein
MVPQPPLCAATSIPVCFEYALALRLRFQTGKCDALDLGIRLADCTRAIPPRSALTDHRSSRPILALELLKIVLSNSPLETRWRMLKSSSPRLPKYLFELSRTTTMTKLSGRALTTRQKPQDAAASLTSRCKSTRLIQSNAPQCRASPVDAFLTTSEWMIGTGFNKISKRTREPVRIQRGNPVALHRYRQRLESAPRFRRLKMSGLPFPTSNQSQRATKHPFGSHRKQTVTGRLTAATAALRDRRRLRQAIESSYGVEAPQTHHQRS